MWSSLGLGEDGVYANKRTPPSDSRLQYGGVNACEIFCLYNQPELFITENDASHPWASSNAYYYILSIVLASGFRYSFHLGLIRLSAARPRSHRTVYVVSSFRYIKHPMGSGEAHMLVGVLEEGDSVLYSHMTSG